MRSVRATRTEDKRHEALVQYCSGSGDDATAFELRENTNLVDGIGGVTWDGALLLCSTIEALSGYISGSERRRVHVVELGCGTGLCGIVAAAKGLRSTVTDRCSDLASSNVRDVVRAWAMQSLDISAFDLSWECAKHVNSTTADYKDTNDEMGISVPMLIEQRGKPDIITGAEITCLRKQQHILADTIAELCDANPSAVVLLTFDDTPPPNGCQYEISMLKYMKERGFRHDVVAVADCEWTISTTHSAKSTEGKSGDEDQFGGKVSTAILRNRTAEFCSRMNPLLSPFMDFEDALMRADEAKREESEHKLDLPIPPPRSAKTGMQVPHTQTVTKEQTTHHVTLFYRPSAVGICKRCHHEYFRLTALHRATPCVFHSQYYVCRYHPAEVRCSINGLGDGLGYYGNGQEGYQAKFWDCCGSEDESAPGCCRGEHVSY